MSSKKWIDVPMARLTISKLLGGAMVIVVVMVIMVSESEDLTSFPFPILPKFLFKYMNAAVLKLEMEK